MCNCNKNGKKLTELDMVVIAFVLAMPTIVGLSFIIRWAFGL